MGYKDETPVTVMGKVGRQHLSDGADASVRLNKDGSMIAGMPGKYADAALDGRLYGVANQAAVAVTADFSATFTGLAVGNPATSGVNCSLLNMSFSNSVQGISIGTVGIMAGLSNLVPIDAALIPQNQKLDGPPSKCTATGGQTINAAPPPTLIRVVGITGTGDIDTWRSGTVNCDLDGAIVIPPGYFWATYLFDLSTATMMFGFTWEEIPI
jgi:hypothetical protein